MKPKMFAGVVFAVVLGILLPAPAPASNTDSIYETVALRSDLVVLSVAIAEAREAEALKSEKQKYTLFAPTDAAFKNLDPALMKKIATDKDFVKQLVRAHIVQGKQGTAALKAPARTGLSALEGGALKFDNAKDGMHVGAAKIVEADIACSNGVIHVIDAVLPVGK